MKHFVLAFLLALVCYALFYLGIEHRRTHKGPWEVTFTNNAAGNPVLLVNQHRLAITNVQLVFPDSQAPSSNLLGTLAFNQPQPVPFPVPFGRCVFMDTTFLPGTVTFQFFGHEIELLPRVLIIDHQEHPWVSDATNTLHSPQPGSSVYEPRSGTNEP